MITIWNHTISSPLSAIKCGAIASNSKAVIAGNPLEYYSYDPFGHKQDLTPPRSVPNIMKVSKNERYLALASDIVDLMDLEKGKVVRQFTEHTNTITGICSHNSIPHIWATVALDKTMRIFDSRVHPGQVLCIRNDVRHRCICYAPNSLMLFCGGDNIFIFDIRMNSEFNSIKTINQVTDIQCHPEDCVVLGCTDDRMVKVWDIDTKECLSQTVPLETQPQKVLFEPLGKLVIASTNQKLYAFDWDPFHLISQIPWSSSRSTNFMVMNGDESERLASPPFIAPVIDGIIDLLDMKVENDMVIHFGVANEGHSNRQTLSVRTIPIERLLDPPSINESVISSSRMQPKPLERVSSPPQASTSSPSSISHISDIDDPLDDISKPSPTVLLPPKAPEREMLIRKIPRSTSSSRNLKSSAPAVTPPSRRNTSNIGPSPHPSPSHASAGPIKLRSRSSSTHSLHYANTAASTSNPTLSSRNVSRKPSGGPRGFDKTKGTSNTFLSMLQTRKNGIQKVKRVMRSRQNNEDEVFDEAISLQDKSVFVHLLQELTKPISLRLAARILPELRFLLSHKNSSFADVALDILNQIIPLQDTIRQGLASNAQSIGVDIAAEQRQMLCLKSKEALTEIYVTSELILGKLTEEQQLRFNSIIDRFIDLVS